MEAEHNFKGEQNEDLRMPGNNIRLEEQVERMEGEIARLQESVERTNSETASELVRLQTRQLDQETEIKSRKWGSSLLLAALLVVAAALIAALWYGYPLLGKHSRLLAQIPDSVHALSNRIDATEQQLGSWASDRDILTGRLEKVEKRFSANLQLARREARQETEQMGARFRQIVQAELDRRVEPMEAALKQLESGRQGDQAQLSQLQSEVNNLKDQVSVLKNETSEQITKARYDNASEIAGLSRAVTSNKRDLNQVARHIDRDRVEIEVAKNEVRELVPGVSLKVTHTNPSYQTVDGWLQLTPDAHTLWVRGQDIQQPIVFYTQRDKRPYELVFTRVSKDTVFGYMLIPTQTTGVNNASLAGETQVASASPPSR